MRKLEFFQQEVKKKIVIARCKNKGTKRRYNRILFLSKKKIIPF